MLYTAICLDRHRAINASSLSEAWDIAIEWAEELRVPMQFADLSVVSLRNPRAQVRGEITAGAL
jgi:hypothetical protein